MQSVKNFAIVLVVWGLIVAPVAAQDMGAGADTNTGFQTCLTLAKMLDLDLSACDSAAAEVRSDPKPQATPVMNANTLVAQNTPHQPGQIQPTQIVAKAPVNMISRPVDYDYRIHFPKGSTILVEEFRQHLDLLASILATPSLASTCLKLVGHSDSSGSNETNLKMGMRRAETVKTYLAARISNGTQRIEIASEGENSPLPGMAAHDPKNRRVEIWARQCQ